MIDPRVQELIGLWAEHMDEQRGITTEDLIRSDTLAAELTANLLPDDARERIGNAIVEHQQFHPIGAPTTLERRILAALTAPAGEGK